jgi:succinyl-diaminopimelate desuccinylase
MTRVWPVAVWTRNSDTSNGLESRLEERVSRTIKRLRKEMVNLAKELISLPMTDPPGENYDPCVKIIGDYLRAMGFQVEILQGSPHRLHVKTQTGERVTRSNVYATLKGKRVGPHLHYNGHYDVVTTSEGWSLDPYKPVARDSKLYGRGSVDMKGAIAAMLVAAKAVISENVALDGTWPFSFVPDEEMDGENGTKFLVEEQKLKPDYCIIGEPSGGKSLFNGHLGYLWLEIKTIGKAAHGSGPWAGVNALEKMVRFDRCA